jgi:uncharacterized protein YgbK (DUF1537 family)
MDQPTPPSGQPAPDAHWITDPALTARLNTATLTLLDLLELQLNDGPVFSEALAENGEHVCELAELDPLWAPVIEADTVRLVAEAAGLPSTSAFSPAVPRIVAAIDRQPLDVQRALVQRASARHVVQDTAIPNARFIAAVAQLPVRPLRNAPPGAREHTALPWSAEEARARSTQPRPGTVSHGPVAPMSPQQINPLRPGPHR